MPINLILARSVNGVIGNDNKLPWGFIKEDMDFFREMTTGSSVIMGRKTYESIGKPLPNRTNIIVTRDANYRVPNAIVVNSIDSAVLKCPRDKDVFVIGGSNIYEQFMARDMVDTIYLTEIDRDYDGDTSFFFNDSLYDVDKLQSIKISSKTGEFYMNFYRYSRNLK